jgi:hypothetical protein
LRRGFVVTRRGRQPGTSLSLVRARLFLLFMDGRAGAQSVDPPACGLTEGDGFADKSRKQPRSTTSSWLIDGSEMLGQFTPLVADSILRTAHGIGKQSEGLRATRAPRAGIQ